MAAEKFRVVLADPPWTFADRGSRIRPRYETLLPHEICALGPLLKPLLADDAFLFLWSTNSHLHLAMHVMEAWGFEQRTMLYWIKMRKDGSQPRYGFGHWTRNAVDPILFGVRGSPRLLWRSHSEDNLVFAPVGQHSKKPEVLYEKIERLAPGPYLELFASRQRPGWTAMGQEIDGLDIHFALRSLLVARAVQQVETKEEP